MNLLPDTHILLWAAAEPFQLSPEATELSGNEESRLFFSAASLWEVIIENGLRGRILELTLIC